MIRRAPRAGGTDVVANRSVFFVLVGDAEDVRNWRHSASAGTSGSPGLRLPSGESAVFFCRHFHTRISRRSCSSDFQFRVALEHDSHGLAACFFGKPGCRNVPSVGGKFAAEAAADVVLMNSDIGGLNL